MIASVGGGGLFIGVCQGKLTSITNILPLVYLHDRMQIFVIVLQRAQYKGSSILVPNLLINFVPTKAACRFV